MGGTREITIYAVPLAGGPVVALARVSDASGSVPGNAPYAVKSDGSIIAISIANTRTTRRITLLEPATGGERWLAKTPSGDTEWGAAWAPDGTLYFARSGPTGGNAILHVAADGSALNGVSVAAHEGAFATVSSVTADGTLIGADQFNGPTAWVLDLASAQEHSFGVHNSSVVDWRPAEPHALVSVITNIAAPGAGYLALWDEASDAKTTVVNVPTAGANFDPSGTKVVAAMSDAPGGESRLVVMNADGSAQTVVPGTTAARSPIWTSSGIVYMTYTPNGPSEVRITSSDGKTSRTLYSGTGQIQRLQVTTTGSN